jgi:hypothetical protein
MSDEIIKNNKVAPKNLSIDQTNPINIFTDQNQQDKIEDNSE